jgi:hypothetical protein
MISMCDTFSALVMKNGDLVFYPEVTDSHEDLVEYMDLRDTQLNPPFLRVEYCPNNDNWSNLDDYRLTYDELYDLDWWTEDLENRTIERLRDRISRLIIREDQRVILGGACILAKDVHVEKIVNARILFADQGSLVDVSRNCSIVNAGYGRFGSVQVSQIIRGNNAQFREVVECHVDIANKAKFGWLRNSHVTNMSDSTADYVDTTTIEHCSRCKINNAYMSIIRYGDSAYINRAEDVIMYDRLNMVIDEAKDILDSLKTRYFPRETGTKLKEK